MHLAHEKFQDKYITVRNVYMLSAEIGVCVFLKKLVVLC